MAVTKVKVHRDPGMNAVVVLFGLSGANLVIKGWLYLFNAVIIGLTEIAERAGPVIDAVIQAFQ